MVRESPVSPDRRKDKPARRVKTRAEDRSRRRKSNATWTSDTLFFGVILFCSGAAALVYQALWIKQLSLVVGVEVFSIAVGVSAFLAGLALGGLVFGRWADRIKDPLRLYCKLETGIGLLGIATTYLMGHTASLFVATEARVGILAWLLPLLLVGLPAFLMGGTVPIAVCSRRPKGHSVATVGGIVYSLNTAGGIAGTLCCVFFFLPSFGVFGTAVAAASLNLMAAFIAYFLSRTKHIKQTEPTITESTVFDREAWVAIALYSVAGGVALGYEVIWSQAIVQFLTTRSFAFSIVLATYLAGLALGSALYGSCAKKITHNWEIFGILIAAAGFVAMAEFACLGIWQLRVQTTIGNLIYAALGNEFARMSGRFFAAAVGIVFVPTLLLGAAFPAALRLIVGANRVGRDVGRIVAFNTVGGIAGALITGFFLVPRLGLIRSIGLLASTAGVIGVVAVFLGSKDNKQSRWIIVSIVAAVFLGSIVTPTDRLARLLIVTRGGGTLESYEESAGGNVAVIQQSTGTNTFRRLYIQGVSNSGDAMPSLRYMRLQALLPLMIHSGVPHSALVIGFGTGITAGALTQFSQLDRIVCAELLPAVVHAAPLFHGNYDASRSTKLQIRLRDGRRELMRSADRYDLITLEPPPPSAAGVVNLYSRDFYRLAATRLQTKGIFAQWLPIATQNGADTRALVRSFLDVFPFATLWTTELHEMLLIGSLVPIELNVDQISERFEQPSVNAALKEVGISSAAALLATWVTGREGLEQYADEILPVTDDRPRIEYSSWVRVNEISRTLPELLALRTEPSLIDSNSAMSSDISTERSNLMVFYAAGLDAYKNDRQSWGRDIGEVLKRDSNNPYYRWTVGKN